MNSLKILAAIAACLLNAAADAGEYIVQTNSRDDVIHLIDPGTQTVVAEIGGLPINHGVAAAPDGSRLYVSSEATRTLDVVDVASRTVTHRLPLTGRPNNIAISPDGRKVYVAITGQDGQINVFDTGALEMVSNIRNNGGVHNVYVTPDGKHVVAGSIGGRNMAVYDRETEERLWSMFDQGVRPITFETDENGETSRAFVHLSGFHGFAVVDFKSREEVRRIDLPAVPEEQQDEGPFNNAPAHGIGIAPDGKTLWHCSRLNGYVYVYSLPDLEYLGGIKAGSHPDWITFSPDGEFAYAANAHSNDVTVIAVDSLEKVATIPVGKSPKRNIPLVTN